MSLNGKAVAPRVPNAAGMAVGSRMAERTVRVASSSGLHARPAHLFTQAAGKAAVRVTLTSASGQSVDASSILGVLSLGVDSGERVTLSAHGDGAEQALDELVALLSRDLDND